MFLGGYGHVWQSRRNPMFLFLKTWQCNYGGLPNADIHASFLSSECSKCFFIRSEKRVAMAADLFRLQMGKEQV